jgi:hypothetical protein
MIEGNSDSGHEYAIHTGLPTATGEKHIKEFNFKEHKNVVKETFGICSNICIDKVIAEKGGNIAKLEVRS